MQLELDENNDIFMGGDGQLSFVKDNLSNVRQRVMCRLRTFQGELFTNRELGVPYFEQFQSKAPDTDSVASLLRVVVSEVDGVDEVTTLSVDFDRRERVFHVSLAIVADGKNIEMEI